MKITSIIPAVLFMLSACSGQKDSKSGSTVDAPKMDLHSAVVTNNLDAVKGHIAAGSNLNEKDPYGGSSPLISAAVFGKPEAAKLLLDAGADIDFQNNDGSTALISSAFFCRKDIVEMLLAKGANKDIKNKYGSTALESVSLPFAQVKDAYDMMGKVLGPMGMKLDYPYIEKTRPEIAAMLK